MDELWQRHKTFILQVVIGGFAFLIALTLVTGSYSGIEEAQASNSGLKKKLDSDVSSRVAPSARSISEQKQRAADAAQQIRQMASEVASTAATTEDYVRENIGWILAVTGRPREDAEKYMSIYRELAETSLTSVREDARSVLVGQAAQRGRQIDETLGLGAGVAASEVPGGLHALAIVCDVVRRALDRDGIVSVTEIKVNPRNTISSDLAWVTGVEIRLSITGDPDDVTKLLRSFNETDVNHPRRMTVLREIESITRRNPDEDLVRANIVLVGLRVQEPQGEDR